MINSPSQNPWSLNFAHSAITAVTLFAAIGLWASSASAQVCDGRLCDTAASYEALKGYEQTVDQWRAMPVPNMFPPHYGQLSLSARDQRKAEDYVDDLDPRPEGTIAGEVRLGLTNVNDDDLRGYPSYQSALFHAIARIYGRLYPGQIEEISLGPGQSLWSDSDTLAIIKDAGIATPTVISFLSGIKYGDYGVKMFCAKNFNLTNSPSTRPVETQLILDYAFDTLTNEVRSGRVPTADLNAAEAITTSLDSGISSRPYIGFQFGFLAEINGAVLLRSLITTHVLNTSSTYAAPAAQGPVGAPPFLLSEGTQFAMPSNSLNGFYAFVARVYSQAIVDLSDGATFGAGAEIYKPWSPAQTAELLALLTNEVPALRSLGTSYITFHTIGLAMAVENDPFLIDRKAFKRRVELAIAADAIISKAADVASEGLEVKPVGPATSFDTVGTIVRQKFILPLTQEEESYKDALERAVDPVGRVVNGN